MKYLRKELKGMEPYKTPYLTTGVILNANESPFNLPDEIIKIYNEELKHINFNRYPDMNSDALKSALANAYGLKKENIACGVGSDEILQCVCGEAVQGSAHLIEAHTLPCLRCALPCRIAPEIAVVKIQQKAHSLVLDALCQPEHLFGVAGAAAVVVALPVVWVVPDSYPRGGDAVIYQRVVQQYLFAAVAEYPALRFHLRKRGDVGADDDISRHNRLP